MDFTTDLDMIINKQRITQKRKAITYNSSGIANTPTWNTVTTADVEIQPIASADQSMVHEQGQKELYSHMIACYYNTAGAKLAVLPGDRFYDASNKFYELIKIEENLGSHFVVYAEYMKGKI